MSTCIRDGHRYKRHRYSELKKRGKVPRSVGKCIHCGHPKPFKLNVFNELMEGLGHPKVVIDND